MSYETNCFSKTIIFFGALSAITVMQCANSKFVSNQTLITGMIATVYGLVNT